MRTLSLLLLAATGLLACNDHSLYKPWEKKKPTVLESATLELEGGNPRRAQEILLAQLPQAGVLLLESDPVSFDSSFIVALASSVQSDPAAVHKLSIYANAEARLADVDALDIITDLAVIDAKEKEKLTLRGQAEDEAISKFYPAMPTVCETEFSGVQRRLDKAMAIILATAILRGFDPALVDSHLREMRAAVSTSDRLNGAIFAQVNFICPVMTYDTDGNTRISEEEAAAIEDAPAEDLYQRVLIAIDTVQAMVDAAPNDETLAKALARMLLYKQKMDDMDASLTIPQKVRAFLVIQTNQ